ncbi:MAG TPA: pirin family protein [Candidatus Limnocylindria bacterium]|nr:pirin family protein [Candidatus Limnocylindria bacterium]
MDREVTQVVTGSPAVDGAGVHVVRVLGHGTTQDFDPFLMLDAFDTRNPDEYTKGFPWHPHRGMETVTYLVHGRIEHEDNLGNKGAITDGTCQWMTAGSGILHQEMPKASPHMLGLQLWLNMPAKDKMAPPAYNDIRHEDIGEWSGPGAKVRVISGEYGGVKARMKGEFVPMTMLDVTLDPGATFKMETPPGDTVFVYLLDGAGRFGQNGHELPARRAALFTPGTKVRFTAMDEGLRLVLCMAPPLKEPIAWGGPVVMNTREELRHAFDELDRGTFSKAAKPGNP